MSHFTISHDVDGTVATFYVRLSEKVVLDTIAEAVKEQVTEESQQIGKKLAEMYAKKIIKQVRQAVRKELTGLKLPKEEQ